MIPSIGEKTVIEHCAALNEMKLLVNVVTESLLGEEAWRPGGLPKTGNKQINVDLIFFFLKKE